MSKQSALQMASQNLPAPEIKPSPVTGPTPENVVESANPSVENGGVVPPSLHSTQLSHLAKKEQKLQMEREAFKKEQEEFKTLKQRAQEFYDKAANFETTRKTDPLKALKEIGFTEKEIIDYISKEEEIEATSPEERAQKAAQAEIQKFREEEAKKLDESQKKNEAALITKFKGQLSSVIKENPEKYELCAWNGEVAEDIMFEIAVAEAKEGKNPDIHSIAEEVENFYLEQFEAMKKLKKLSPKEEAVLEVKKEIERSRVVHPPEDIVKPKATTITSRVTATAAALAKPSNRMESREEKRERLEALIRNGWKK